MGKVENCDFARFRLLVFVLDLDGLSAGEALVVPKKALVHLTKYLKYLLKYLKHFNSAQISQHLKYLLKCLGLALKKRQFRQEIKILERYKSIEIEFQHRFPTSPL